MKLFQFIIILICIFTNSATANTDTEDRSTTYHHVMNNVRSCKFNDLLMIHNFKGYFFVENKYTVRADYNKPNTTVLMFNPLLPNHHGLIKIQNPEEGYLHRIAVMTESFKLKEFKEFNHNNFNILIAKTELTDHYYTFIHKDGVLLTASTPHNDLWAYVIESYEFLKDGGCKA